MEFILIWIVPIVGALIWHFITEVAIRVPGEALNQKFCSLGTLKGKTLKEITTVCGAPNAISSIGNGQTLRQWQTTSYHIALIFDENDICLGVSSEISV